MKQATGIGEETTRRCEMSKMIYGVIVAVWAGCVGSGLAGSLEAPAAPTSAGSAMWTVNDIYNVMDTRTTNVTLRGATFVEPTDAPTNAIGTMHTLNEIMGLVTNRAPVARTGQTNVFLVGDDGTYQAGVAWTSSSRFSYDANVVTDKVTGLIWLRSTTNWGLVSWTNALIAVSNMNYNLLGTTNYGNNDWRLTNIKELYSLIDLTRSSPALPAAHPFYIGGGNYHVWSSTTAPGTGTNNAYEVLLGTGVFTTPSKTSAYGVWPVRGGR